MDEVAKALLSAWPSLVLPAAAAAVVGIGIVLFYKQGVEGLRQAVAGLREANDNLRQEQTHLRQEQTLFRTQVEKLSSDVKLLHREMLVMRDVVLDVQASVRSVGAAVQRLSTDSNERSKAIAEIVSLHERTDKKLTDVLAGLERRFRSTV